ncbi:MAG: haloacid dehalogenase-like hydrolase [Alphaproteobacteria bacterium]|nr:haloacid dehalogenase-like hydrolase [Alphaproteobacteria bacterium]
MKKIQPLVMLIGLVLFYSSIATPAASAAEDPLSFWNDTDNKTSIVNFVQKVNKKNIPIKDRIATFDFDGTIGVEKPTYMEVIVSSKKMCDIAKENKNLRDKQPYKAACAKNWELINSNFDYTIQIILDAFDGQTLTSYQIFAENFLSTTNDPTWKQPYKKLVYAPMVQLVHYLLKNQFTIYVVSGSQTAFLRVMAEGSELSLGSNKVIGSTIKFSYKQGDTGGAEFIRDNSYMTPQSGGNGKPELIKEVIGKMPIFSAGNTMGDFEMLLSTTQKNNIALTGFSLIVNHDDAKREYKYADENLLKQAKKYKWAIVSMKKDFKEIFPFKKQ